MRVPTTTNRECAKFCAILHPDRARTGLFCLPDEASVNSPANDQGKAQYDWYDFVDFLHHGAVLYFPLVLRGPTVQTEDRRMGWT